MSRLDLTHWSGAQECSVLASTLQWTHREFRQATHLSVLDIIWLNHIVSRVCWVLTFFHSATTVSNAALVNWEWYKSPLPVLIYIYGYWKCKMCMWSFTSKRWFALLSQACLLRAAILFCGWLAAPVIFCSNLHPEPSWQRGKWICPAVPDIPWDVPGRHHARHFTVNYQHPGCCGPLLCQFERWDSLLCLLDSAK